jgi:hypothetical protein
MLGEDCPVTSIPVKTQQSHGEKTEPSSAKQNNWEVKKMPNFITQITQIFPRISKQNLDA